MSTVTKPPSHAGPRRFAVAVPGRRVRDVRKLIRATPERTAIRMACDGKDLEIMVKGPVHDYRSHFLDRIIGTVARALGIPRIPLGETTWIRPGVERGLEADRCYIFDPDKIAITSPLLRRTENDVAGYPNPDLAVEVDISRPQVDRPGIYAALGVPELWVCEGLPSPSSSLGPMAGTSTSSAAAGCPSRPLTRDWLEDAMRWLVEDGDDQDAWEDRLRAWAEALP